MKNAVEYYRLEVKNQSKHKLDALLESKNPVVKKYKGIQDLLEVEFLMLGI